MTEEFAATKPQLIYLSLQSMDSYDGEFISIEHDAGCNV